MTNYNNFFNRSVGAFFSEKFYNFVFREQSNNGFSTIIIILFFTYFIPSIIIYNKLVNFTYQNNDNEAISELKEALFEVPNVTITDGILDHNDDLPKAINISLLDKNLLVIDKEQDSLITSNSSVLFSKDGIYFNSLDLVGILLKLLNIQNVPTGSIDGNASFVQYSDVLTAFDGDFLTKWSEKYINSLGGNLLYSLLPSVVILSIIFKFIEVFFLSFITRFIAVKLRVDYTPQQIFRLTAAAMIPALVIKLINASSLWSSTILLMQPAGTLLLISMNLYFMYFAVKSVKS